MSGVERTVRPATEIAPRKVREWTTREVAYLREHYVADGAEAVSDALGRSMRSVYQHARHLGLRRPRTPRRGMFEVKWTTSDQIDAVIRRAFTGDPTSGFVARCAKSVGRPRWWVSKRAAALGLSPPRFKEPAWSDREMEILSSNGHKPVQSIKEIMRRNGFIRTITAIGVRLSQAKIDRTDDDRLSGAGLAEALGVNGTTVCRWVEKGWLKAERRGGQWSIHRRDIRQFIIENVAAVDLRKVEKHWFVDLLAEKVRER